MLTKDIPVIKLRWAAWGLAILLLVVGLVSFILFGGFNLGVDFESGLSQRIRVAPVGLEVSYDGTQDVVLSISSSALSIEQRGDAGVQVTVLRFAEYPNAASLAQALNAMDGIEAAAVDGSLISSTILSGYGFPATLSSAAVKLNFQGSGRTSIEEVRKALDTIGNAKVQTVGGEESSTFQVRLGIKDGATQSSLEEEVKGALGAHFGTGNVVVLQSDYIGPKFSKTLVTSSVLAIAVALALILIYVWFRFRFAYAVSSLVALVHDVLAMLTMITLLRLEFSSTTIAALLTIIGYSLNNTIVIFDRVRENVEINKSATLETQIDRSVTQSMSRTVMSALTTLLAIVPLAIFASGDIRLFSVNMIFGLFFGTYSSNFLAPTLLHWISKAQGKAGIKAK
ncbi:MAG: protein translocase subunit SecF [Sphaerochaeta sp.]|jgi:preprotein translocase subunit SecF|nr:protein translocase subunit SecF [Sphaerochaeta sp.]MDX9915017.1 protein translocase subunit SecF [Sphaerochaeta sp.]